MSGDGGLRLEGISHRYPGAAADSVTAIDLTVPTGSMLALVGPSGSGKSTLLRVAAGLERPREGRVLLGGRDVTALPPERRGLSVVSQRPHLFDHLDVTDNVAFGPRVAGASRREARARAARYLDLVHLDGLGSRRPGRLSGGQQQRVALARALATGREVLLLDEPFGFLDPELRGAMHALLGELRAAVEPTLLLVTHDLDEAALAEQVGVLVEGRLHQVGTPGELYRRPASLTVARLLGGFVEVPGEVVDGSSGLEHRSGWGAWPLPGECPVRGPGVLLVRREELRLAPGEVTTAAAGEHDGPSTAGRVVGSRRLGARELAVVETAAPVGQHAGPHVGPHVEIEVELPLRETAPVGAPVRVTPVAGASGWAVAVPSADPTDPTRHTRHADDLPRSPGRSCDHAGRD